MKKITQYYLSIILLVTALSFSSCTDNNDPNAKCEDLFCTEEFRTILISIKDQNQTPVIIDSFKVIDLSNDNDITIPVSASGLQLYQQNGQYPLVNDMSFEQNVKTQIQFFGYKDNQEIINEKYTVSTDCCHISLVSGTIEIML
ncbi:MAG: hypothetical protein MK202_11890 [Tenacibaculum sp.]|nr:hypothetical protein [Tenacibaculum sp.]